MYWHQKFDRWDDVEVLVIVDDKNFIDGARKALGGDRRRVFVRPIFTCQTPVVFRHAAIATEQLSNVRIARVLVNWYDLIFELNMTVALAFPTETELQSAYFAASEVALTKDEGVRRRILLGDFWQIRHMLMQSYGKEMLNLMAMAVPAWLPSLGRIVSNMQKDDMAAELLYVAALAKQEPYRSRAIASLVYAWNGDAYQLLRVVEAVAHRIVPREYPGASDLPLRVSAAAFVGKRIDPAITLNFVEAVTEPLNDVDKADLRALARGEMLKGNSAGVDLLERLAGRDPGESRLKEWLNPLGLTVTQESQPWWRIVNSSPPDAVKFDVLFRTR